MKKQNRAEWMSKFEQACLDEQVPDEVIHGESHDFFWNTANFYFTQGVEPVVAARKYATALAAKQ
jgi:hypothetical protein